MHVVYEVILNNIRCLPVILLLLAPFGLGQSSRNEIESNISQFLNDVEARYQWSKLRLNGEPYRKYYSDSGKMESWMPYYNGLDVTKKSLIDFRGEFEIWNSDLDAQFDKLEENNDIMDFLPPLVRTLTLREDLSDMTETRSMPYVKTEVVKEVAYKDVHYGPNCYYATLRFHGLIPESKETHYVGTLAFLDILEANFDQINEDERVNLGDIMVIWRSKGWWFTPEAPLHAAIVVNSDFYWSKASDHEKDPFGFESLKSQIYFYHLEQNNKDLNRLEVRYYRRKFQYGP